MVPKALHLNINKCEPEYGAKIDLRDHKFMTSRPEIPNSISMSTNSPVRNLSPDVLKFYEQFPFDKDIETTS